MKQKRILACYSVEVRTDYLACTDDFELIACEDSVGLVRVRQKATRVDSENKNKRIYPRHVMAKAISDARPMALAGAMLSEYEHPKVVTTNSGEAFIDNPERKSARVDDIEDPDADGWVHITRTILPTPQGKELAERYRSGNPPGISTRFKMTGKTRKVGNRQVFVADEISIITWDDVESPAVDGTKEYRLLTDAELESLNDGDKQMDWKQLLQKVRSLIQSKASSDEVTAAMTEVKTAYDAMDQAMQATAKAEYDEIAALAGSAGYRSGPGPSVIPAGATGDLPLGAGFASGLQGNGVPTPSPKTSVGDATVVLSQDDITFLQTQRKQAANQKAEQERLASVNAAIDSVTKENAGFAALDSECQDYILTRVRVIANRGEDVRAVLDSELETLGKLLAKSKLESKGARGNTVDDPGHPGRIEVREQSKLMASIDHLCAIADDQRNANIHNGMPSASNSVRDWNKKNVIFPFLNQMARIRGHVSADAWFATDGIQRRPDGLYYGDAQTFERIAAGDATTTSELYNQPTIAGFLLVQMFQDLTALQYVSTIGPGMRDERYQVGEALDEGRIGSVLRWASEYYVQGGTYDQVGGRWDAGLLVPESTAIPEFQLKTAWTPFAALWKRLGFSLTRDAVRAMGNGPLNYDALFRHMVHSSWRIARGVDWLLYDEMTQVSDRYGAVAVSAEAPSLANQSVYLAGGSVSVNLNPTKTAVAAYVSTTDQRVTYGTNVVAAIRLKTRGNGTSSPYMGTTNGNDPIVKPQSVIDLTAAGAVSTSTSFGITFGGTGNATWVRGELDSNYGIVDRPGAGTANYAIDWENGVIVFTSGGYTNGGWGNGGGVLTGSDVTISYSYGTNHDNFIINNPTLPTGKIFEEYLRGLFTQIDSTAATMGSSPRFVRPDLALMNLSASVNITTADIFDKFKSPAGTNYFPTDSYFAERNGVQMARHNSDWTPGNQRILLTRRGSTKYVVDTPLEVFGPVPKYSGTSMIAAQGYYTQENSCICTPQVVNQAGTVINPVSRSIKLR